MARTGRIIGQAMAGLADWPDQRLRPCSLRSVTLMNSGQLAIELLEHFNRITCRNNVHFSFAG